MPAKSDVIECLKTARDDLVAIAERAGETAWENATYGDDGWNCRQLLYHLASTSAPAGFVLAMSKLPAGSGGAAFDGEAFNRQQVEMREGRSVAEALDEIRANIQRDIQAVEAASDDDLQRTWTAPWGTEGTVAQIIIDSTNGHLGGHIADLRGALGD